MPTNGEYQTCPICHGRIPERFNCRTCKGNGYTLKVTRGLLTRALRGLKDAIERAKGDGHDD